MARDFQRQRVYDWETSFVDPHDRIRRAGKGPMVKVLTLDECRAIVAQAYWGRFPGPEVTDGRARRRASGSARRIKLPRWTRYPAAVLHECAHGLKKNEGPAHGPEFVAKLIELLVTIEGHDLSLLLRSARSCGVQVADRPYHQWQEAAGPTR